MTREQEGDAGQAQGPDSPPLGAAPGYGGVSEATVGDQSSSIPGEPASREQQDQSDTSKGDRAEGSKEEPAAEPPETAPQAPGQDQRPPATAGDRAAPAPD